MYHEYKFGFAWNARNRKEIVKIPATVFTNRLQALIQSFEAG